ALRTGPLRNAHQNDLRFAGIERGRKIDRDRLLGADRPPVRIICVEEKVDLLWADRDLRRWTVRDRERYARGCRTYDLADLLPGRDLGQFGETIGRVLLR